jgi:hypothetical protein
MFQTINILVNFLETYQLPKDAHTHDMKIMYMVSMAMWNVSWSWKDSLGFVTFYRPLRTKRSTEKMFCGLEFSSRFQHGTVVASADTGLGEDYIYMFASTYAHMRTWYVYIWIYTCLHCVSLSLYIYVLIICVCSHIVIDLHFGTNITPKEVLSVFFAQINT